MMAQSARLFTVSFLMAVLGFASITRGDLMLEFNDANGTPSSNFITTVGGTVDVRIYLKETSTTILNDEELFGASVKVTFDSPSVAVVQNVSDVMPNSAFIDLTPPPAIGSMDAGFTGSVDLDPFLTVELGNRIFLGSFRFTGLNGGTVNLLASDRDGDSDDTITGLATVLDGLIDAGAATLTVAIPESSAWLMMMFTTVPLVCVKAWRSRKVAGPT